MLPPSVLSRRFGGRDPLSCRAPPSPAADDSLLCGREMLEVTGSSLDSPSLVAKLKNAHSSIIRVWRNAWKDDTDCSGGGFCSFSPLCQPCCSSACSECLWWERTSVALEGTPQRSCAWDGCSSEPSTHSWETTMTNLMLWDTHPLTLNYSHF